MSNRTPAARAAYLSARRWISRHARPLEAARAEARFDGEPADAAVDFLAAFQNEDGGFGHGLESDIRTRLSTPIATSVAFQVFDELGVPGDHPALGRAMGYLRATFDPATASWPQTVAGISGAPHAPWWTGSDDPARAVLNPRAELLGVLARYPDRADPAQFAAASEGVGRALESAGDAAPEMHDLLCLARLLRVPQFEAPWRADLAARMPAWAAAATGKSAADWDNYGLLPVDLAPTPDDPLAPALAEWVEPCLDYLVASQEECGAWSPPWSWGDQHPREWAEARREWQGVLTLKNLGVLRAYGRLPDR